jgi:2-oxoglutarate dehydrogenase E2 component (dihydrolipoamide succinyltransferase)
MKKLVTLFATLALASTLSLTGCKKKEEAAKTEPAATEAPKTTEPAKTEPAPAAPADPAAAPAAPAAPADPAAAPAAAAGDLPAECNDYKAALEKVAACDKLPAPAKDAYKNAWAGVETSLKAATTPETKAAVASACKAGADSLKQAAAACL